MTCFQAVVVLGLGKVLGASGECVGFAVLFTRDCFDNKVKLREELAPSDLALSELFSGHEILQIGVIGDYCDRVGSAL